MVSESGSGERGSAPRVVAIIPALNEAAVIGRVVTALRTCREVAIAHVIVCDNGSNDDTARIAVSAGAIVVSEPRRGYGAACLAAIGAHHAEGLGAEILLFVDGDGSVCASEAKSLVQAIRDGADLAVGVRVPDLQARGALTYPQRVGNLVACVMIRAIWGVRMRDLGPFRAIRTSALAQLAMADMHFGWTVEMQVKAIQQGLRYAETPVSTRVRVGKSKISGTVRGVIGAAHGIIGMIVRLRWQEWRRHRTARPRVSPPTVSASSVAAK